MSGPKKLYSPRTFEIHVVEVGINCYHCAQVLDAYSAWLLYDTQTVPLCEQRPFALDMNPSEDHGFSHKITHLSAGIRY
jgi:hypothetical protein